MAKCIMAPFETFAEHGERERSEEPYSDNFIKRCRAKALEYDEKPRFIRISMLEDLQRCIPFHRRSEVFNGIFFDKLYSL